MALKTYHLASEAAPDGGDTTDTVWKAQTFVPLSSHTATSIQLRVWRSAGLTGTITVSLRATAAGLPIGGDLASGTIDISTLDASTPGQFHTVTLNVGVGLTAGTRYAIVYRRSNASGAVYFRVSTASAYGFGQYCSSNDSGSSWALPGSPNNNDVVFKINDDSSYISQVLFVAGNVSGGNHIWKVIDDGSILTTDSQAALAGNVTCMVWSADSRRLYVGIGNAIYCLDENLAVVTAWGTAGSVSVGAAVNGLAVDSSDYLAVAHNLTNGGRISLYNEAGTLQWTSTVFAAGTGYRVDFDIDGNIAGCTQANNSSSKLAALVSRASGTLLATYLGNVGVAGFNAFGIRASDTLSAYVWYGYNYSGGTIAYSNSTPDDWAKVISGTSQVDIEFVDSIDLVVVVNSNQLIGYDATTGLAHPWADYSPNTVNPVSSSILAIQSDGTNIYIADNGGNLSVAASSLSARVTTAISGAALNAVAWAGDQYVIPVISDQSSDTTADEGDLVEFFVTATGIPSPTYQWYKDDVLIDGETNSTITFSSVNRTDAGTYKCTVTNVAGAVDSSPIILTVYYSEITAQSSDSVFGIGQLMTLTVTAIGNPVPTYQWYKDDVIISGAVSSSYSKYVVLLDAGTYKCKVSNAVGDIYTTGIVVSIVVNPYVLGINLNLDMDRG